MITVPMKVAVSQVEIPMSVSHSNVEIEMSVSAEFSIAGADEYEGAYSVTPLVSEQTLETANKLMREDVLVLGVPYYETSNLTGETVYIASEV